MLSPLKNRFFIAAFLLLIPCVAFATDIAIDGTCVQGTCAQSSLSGTGDAVQFGQSVSGSGSQSETVNGDQYSVAYSYSASYGNSGSAIFVDPVVTYVGLTPTTTTDTLTFLLYQSYYDASPGTWNGEYSETVPLSVSAGAGSGSSASGEASYGTPGGTYYGLGEETQTGIGSSTGTGSSDLTALGSGDNLVAEYNFTFVFGAGTTDGSAENSPASNSTVPEPAETLPVGLALSGIACYAVARRRSSYSR